MKVKDLLNTIREAIILQSIIAYEDRDYVSLSTIPFEYVSAIRALKASLEGEEIEFPNEDDLLRYIRIDIGVNIVAHEAKKMYPNISGGSPKEIIQQLSKKEVGKVFFSESVMSAHRALENSHSLE